MARTHLPATSIELLQPSLSDKSLKAVISESIGKFARASQHLVEPSKVDAATQTEEAAGMKKSHFKSRRLDDALRQ